jgi:hypothetical protein
MDGYKDCFFLGYTKPDLGKKKKKKNINYVVLHIIGSVTIVHFVQLRRTHLFFYTTCLIL